MARPASAREVARISPGFPWISGFLAFVLGLSLDSSDFGSVSASSISACFGFWLGSGSGLDLPLSLCFPKDFHPFLASRRHSELSREVLGPP